MGDGYRNSVLYSDDSHRPEPRKSFRRHWRNAPWEYSGAELLQIRVESILNTIYGENI